jgi:hypothetical protein
MKIGIIGSGGVIGGMIGEFLFLEGVQTVGFARHKNPEFEYLDVLDFENPTNFSHIDYVVYCSWATKNRTKRSQAEHAKAAGHWARIAKENGCKFIFISTVLASANAKSNYGIYKYVAETKVEEFGGKSLRLGLVADDAYDLLLTKLRRLDRKFSIISELSAFQIYAVSSSYFLNVLMTILNEWPKGSVFWVAPEKTESLSVLVRSGRSSKITNYKLFRFTAKMVAALPIARGSVGAVIDGIKGVVHQDLVIFDQNTTCLRVNTLNDWDSNLFL